MLNSNFAKKQPVPHTTQSNLKSVVIFGASGMGRAIYNYIKDTENVLFFIDSDPENCYAPPAGLALHHPDALLLTAFDVVYIASVAGANKMNQYLENDLQIDTQKISRAYATINFMREFIMAPRIRFIEQFATYANMRNIDGAIAEVGVLRGDSAKEINYFFPNRKLYLFDTFEGFNDCDFSHEAKVSSRYDQMEEMRRTFCNAATTSVDIVIEKMPYPDMCVIKQGVFPDTFDIENEKFVFVHLDTDLYHPTLAGLKLFYPMMQKGGVILVHDYFGGATLGVRKAVDEFIDMYGLTAMPIGDYSSISICVNAE